MAQSLLDMNWIGEDEFNVFIHEVAAIHTANESEDAQEVTDADFNPEHADLADLKMNSNHVDLAKFAETLSPSQKQAYDFITQSGADPGGCERGLSHGKIFRSLHCIIEGINCHILFLLTTRLKHVRSQIVKSDFNFGTELPIRLQLYKVI